MTLLQRLHRERSAAREALRIKVRQQLRRAVQTLLPMAKVVVFGSLTKSGCFNEFSDVDLALESEPDGMSIYQVTALLAEELGRPVDVVLLPECRFRDRIKREGEVWTRQD